MPKHLGPSKRDKVKTGRHSTYTTAIAAELCRRLSIGDLLIDICVNPPFPPLSTVYRWSERYPVFREMLIRAREDQAHAVAERAVRAGRSATAETAAAARVQFDADRWFAARLLPKVYGDKVEHSGNIDVTVGLADRLDAARKRLAAAAAGKLIEGTVVAADPPKPDGEC